MSNGGGECLACKRISTCTETNEVKIYQGYTCPLFSPVHEAEYTARCEMVLQFGNEQAIAAMLNRPKGEVEDA